MKKASPFSTVVLLAVLLFVAFGASKARAGEKRFRITLEFSEPAYRCSEVVKYRDDFHCIMERRLSPTFCKWRELPIRRRA